MKQGQFLSGGKTDLNSAFSFSQTGCLTKAEESSLSNYLLIASEERNRWIHAFSKSICVKWNKQCVCVGGPVGVMVKAMDCGIVVSEFKH